MKTTALYLLILSTIPAFAQRPDCDVSLTADRYFNSMAIAPTEEEAQANALNFLATQISATVSAKSELISTDQNTRVDQTFVSQSQSVSRLKLNGVNYQSCLRKKKTDPYRVIAYISKEDLRRSGEQVANEVGQYLELMSQKRDMGVGFIADAYTAYLTTFTTPFAIADTIDRKPVSNVQAWLESMLRTYISKVQVTCQTATASSGNDGQVSLHLRVIGASDPQAKFVLQLPSWNASHELTYEGGTYDVVMQPASAMERFRGTLELKPSQMSSELKELAAIIPISREIEFSADMRGAIGLNLEASDLGLDWMFRPRYRELSVRQVEWFVDGTLYNTQIQLRLPKAAVTREIMMRLNGQDALSVRRQLQPDGNFAVQEDGVAAVPSTPDRASGIAPKPQAPRAEDPTKAGRAPDASNAGKQQPAKPVNPEGSLTAANRELLGAADFPGLTALLVRYRAAGVLQFGKRSDFLRPEACWVFLVNPGTKNVERALEPGNTTRFDHKSGGVLEDFEKYASGLVAIWVQFN